MQIRVLFFACTLTYGIMDAMGTLEHSLPAALGFVTEERKARTATSDEGSEASTSRHYGIEMQAGKADPCWDSLVLGTT